MAGCGREGEGVGRAGAAQGEGGEAGEKGFLHGPDLLIR